MSMERWNPFRDMDSMRQAMDRWMDDRFSGGLFNNQQGNMLSVALDIHETGNGYELEASLPGVRAEDVDINVERDTVTIRGQSSYQNERTEGRNYLYRERRSGSFFRTIRLPEPVDADRVEASLDHGILRVQLPKLTQTQQRRVQVRSGMSGNPGFSSQTNIPQSQVSGQMSGSQSSTGMGTRMENSGTRGWNQAGDQGGMRGGEDAMRGGTGSSGQHGSGFTAGGQGSQQTGGSGSSYSGGSIGNNPGSMHGSGLTSNTPGLNTGAGEGQSSTGSMSSQMGSSGSGSTAGMGGTSTYGSSQSEGSFSSGSSSMGNSSGVASNASGSGDTSGLTTTGSGSPQDMEPKPGTVAPGASHGEHSQIDHRNQVEAQNYPGGASSTNAGRGNTGTYGAGQGGDNLSQSQTMGNEG